MMEVTPQESSVEAASPRRRPRSAPRDTDGPTTERGPWRRAAEASASRTRSPVPRFDTESDSAREAEAEPATPRKKARIAQPRQEACVEAAASPRKRARNAPRGRDADGLATTRNRGKGAWGRAEEEASASRTRSPVASDSAEAEPATPHKKARVAKQEASASAKGNPAPWFDPERCGKDSWTEITKHISGLDLIRLSHSCSWLFNLLADDSIWRYAFFRELKLLGDDHRGYDFFRNLHPPAIELDLPDSPSRYWRRLYFANGLHDLFDKKTEPGMNVIHCPGCAIVDCTGTTQDLEARHCDLFLEGLDRYRQKDLGQYLADEETTNAFCGIFNRARMELPRTRGVASFRWTGKKLLTSSWRSPYAATMNTSLQSNQGLLLSRFEVARPRDDMMGQVMCIRIVQIQKQGP